MKEWTKITLTSAYDVLTKQEIAYIKKNKGSFLEQNQCHYNAARIAITLSKKFGTKIEFCEGCFCLEKCPTFMHCWNRVFKDGEWKYIDLTAEVLNENQTKGDEYLLCETWTAEQIKYIFDNEGFSFVPFNGTSDWGDKDNIYYTKDENGNPVRNVEICDWKLIYKRYGIEVKEAKKLSEVLAKQSA